MGVGVENLLAVVGYLVRVETGGGGRGVSESWCPP